MLCRLHTTYYFRLDEENSTVNCTLFWEKSFFFLTPFGFNELLTLSMKWCNVRDLAQAPNQLVLLDQRCVTARFQVLLRRGANVTLNHLRRCRHCILHSSLSQNFITIKQMNFHPVLCSQVISGFSCASSSFT